MSLPLGEGTNAPPSNEDIARVVVACLIDPKPHVGKAYRPTGPRLLGPDEIAAIFGKVLGRRVRYQNAPLDLFLKVAKMLGVSDYVISQLYRFLKDYQSDARSASARRRRSSLKSAAPRPKPLNRLRAATSSVRLSPGVASALGGGRRPICSGRSQLRRRISGASRKGTEFPPSRTPSSRAIRPCGGRPMRP